MKNLKKCTSDVLKKSCKPQRLDDKCKQKITKLVFKDHPKIARGSCEKKEYVPKISKQCGTKIRYCTAKELKMLAGPQIYDCPEDGGIEYGNILGSTLLNVLKAATVLTTGYLMYQLGFWGSPSDTEHLFRSVCRELPCPKKESSSTEPPPKTAECVEESELLSITPEDPCACEDPIPIDFEKCSYKMKVFWNKMVMFVFGGLVVLPLIISEFFMKYVLNLFQSEKECDIKCKPMVEEDEDFHRNQHDDCELIDDYDEKYPPDEEEEIEALLEGSEGKEDST